MPPGQILETVSHQMSHMVIFLCGFYDARYVCRLSQYPCLNLFQTLLHATFEAFHRSNYHYLKLQKQTSIEKLCLPNKNSVQVLYILNREQVGFMFLFRDQSWPIKEPF